MLSLRRQEAEAPGRWYNPGTPALAPELGRAFAAQCALPTSKGEGRLRDATTALVQRLKVDDLAPERVVVAIKAAITRYGHQTGQPSLWSDTEDETPAHDVYRRVFHWMLESYFNSAGV